MDYKPHYSYIPPLEFHALTRFYDLALISVGFGKKFRKKIVDAVEVKDSYTILDVGCGTGAFLEILRNRYPKVSAIGIDPDEQALSIASKRLQAYPNVTFINSFAESLPFENDTFDTVYSTLAFHHLPTEIKKKAVEEIYRVLKPRGKLVIVDFGTAKHHRFYRTILFWEPFEYMEGNLQGLIPEFMKKAGFKNITEDSIKFPVIHLLIGAKEGV